MNKKCFLLVTMLVAAGALNQASAAVMTVDNSTPGVIVQTYDSGAFQPGVPSVIPILFEQFDTLGGTRTLLSVTVTVTQSAWGGYYAVDNDGATAASVTVQHGATGSISMTPGYEFFLPVGALSTLSTVVSSGGAQVLAANTVDNDAVDVYNEGGADSYRLNGPTEGNALLANATGSRTTGLEAYIGAGNLSLDYTVSQSSMHLGEGAVYYSGGPAWVHSEIIVTYEYTPEPTSLALFVFGCAALGLRRRKHTA